MMNIVPFALRRRVGLRWPDNKPPLAHSVPHFLFAGLMWLAVVLLYGWMQERDLADKSIARAEIAERMADKAEKALVRCLNGNAAFIIEGERNAVWCDRATIQSL